MIQNLLQDLGMFIGRPDMIQNLLQDLGMFIGRPDMIQNLLPRFRYVHW